MSRTIKTFLSKKIIFLFVVLTILASLSAFNTVVAQETKSEQLNVLQSLGLLDKSLKLDNEVLRGEVALLIAKMLNINTETLLNEGATVFTDVPETRSDCYAISQMKQLRIMSGSNDLFMPDQPINIVQLSKVFVSLLGYDEFAKAKGGYPTGYKITALNLGILDGISIKDDDFVTVNEVSKMAYKSLKVKLYDSFDKTISNENIASKYLKLSTAKGFVQGSYYSNITDSFISKNHILIDNVSFVCAQDFTNYIAQKVEYFYTEINDQDRTIVAMEPLSDNKELVVDVRNLSTRNQNELYYEDVEGNLKEIKYKIPFVMINGTRTAKFVMTDLFPANGRIRFLDNNGDGVYEYAFVQSFENIIVGDITTNIISDRFGKPNVDVRPDNIRDIFFIKDGVNITKNTIQKNDVISVESGERYIKLYISSRIENGVITEKTISNGKDVYVINGFPYNVDESYEDYPLNPISSNNINSVLKIGQQGQFYIDIQNNIVGMQVTLDNSVDIPPNLKQYGYVIGVANYGGLKGSAIKLLSEKSGITSLELKDKVLYNASSLNADAAITSLNSFIGNTTTSKENLYKRVITYKLNSQKEVTEINTVVLNGQTKPSVDSPVLYDKYIGTADTKKISTRINAKAFANYYYTTSQTRCFIIPSDKEREAEYLSTSFDKYYTKDGIAVEGFFFDIDDMFNTSFVLDVTGTDGEFSSNALNSAMFVVDNITKVVMEDEEIMKINGYDNCVKKSYYVRSKTLMDKIKQDNITFGDVLRIRVAGSYIVQYDQRRIFPTRQFIMPVSSESTWSNDYWIFGKIMNKSDIAFKLAVGLDIDNKAYSGIGKSLDPKFGQYVAVPYVSYGAPPAFVLVDMVAKRMKMISPKEVEVGDFAYMFAQNGAYVKSVVIYKMPTGYFEANFIME